MSKNIFKYPALITCVVKFVHDKYPNMQIGKTYIQKMVYLLTCHGIFDINYSMHYYGPYSKETANEVNFAESIGIINIKWVDDKGYFISVNQSNFERFEENIKESERQAIAQVADRFGRFKAVELSIIATAIYLQDNSNVPEKELVDAIHDLKPEYTDAYIKRILKEGGIISS